MEQFVAAVFADRDVVSFCGPLHSAALEWMVWLRPSAANDSMHLNVYVRRKEDQTDFDAFDLTVTVDVLQNHMNELGVTSDLSSFALSFKTALSARRSLNVDEDENGAAVVEITYVFGPSLTRKGMFTLPSVSSASVPRHVVDLLQSLRTIVHETTEEQTSRRARRSTLLLSAAAAPIQLATAGSPLPHAAAVKRKPVLPLGARRKVTRGAKFADDDE